MFCIKCSVRNPDDANYCHSCGNPTFREGEDKRQSFVPYEVYIRPNFYTILTDFDLLKDTASAWSMLATAIGKVPSGPWNIWGGIGNPGIGVGESEPYGGGFSFSFISPQLIWKPAWNGFASEINISASLEPVAVRRELLRDQSGQQALFEEYYPYLNLRSVGEGYRLSIEVPESHWNAVRHSDAFKDIADEDVPRHALQGDLAKWSPAVDVPLAVVPYEEFGANFAYETSPSRYGRPCAWSYANGANEEAVKRRALARAHYGWKGNTAPEANRKAPTSERSDFAEHRFALVLYWAL